MVVSHLDAILPTVVVLEEAGAHLLQVLALGLGLGLRQNAVSISRLSFETL